MEVGFCFGFFFSPLKGCQENLPLTIGLTSRLSLEFISPLPAPGHVLGQVMFISVIHRNAALMIWVASEHPRKCCSYRKCPRGSSITQAYLWFLGNQNLRESLLLGQWNREEGAWANPKGLESLESRLSFPLKHHTNSPPWRIFPGPQCTAEGA